MANQLEIPGAERPKDEELEALIEKIQEHQEKSKRHGAHARQLNEEARQLVEEKGLPWYIYFDGDVPYVIKPTSKKGLSRRKYKGEVLEGMPTKAETIEAANDEAPKKKTKAQKSRKTRKAKASTEEQPTVQ